MFQIQNSTKDPSPYLVYPEASNKVWVVTVPFGGSRITQIVNFTLQSPGSWTSRPVVNLTNTNVNDIIYDKTTNRVWLLENESLAYYDQTQGRIVVGETFHNGSPAYFAIDSHDRFWITLFNNTQIAEYSPSSGKYNVTSAPTSSSGLYGITVSPTDGAVWFAEAYTGKIGRLAPCDAPECPVTEYSPPQMWNLYGMVHVVVDNNGIVWFTIHSGNEFGSFNPSTGEWRLFPTGYCPENNVVDCTNSLPNAISTDKQGQIWFSEHYAGRIARYNPSTGQLIEYNIPTSSKVCKRACAPYDWWMWPSPDSNLVWFAAVGLGEIGYVNASIPVSTHVDAPSMLTLQQGSSMNLALSATFTGVAPSLNVSATYVDLFPEPPALSWSVGPPQLSTIGLSVASSVILSTAWSSSLGSRYIAASATSQNLTVNGYIRIIITGSLRPYTTIGLAGGLTAFTSATVALSWHKRRKPKKEKDVAKRD